MNSSNKQYSFGNENADTDLENNDWGAIPPKKEYQEQQKPFHMDNKPTNLLSRPEITTKEKTGEYKKSPIAASFLSFLLVGLGQMYLGQVAKGIFLLVFAYVLGAITYGASFFIMVPIAMVDAYCIGKKMKKNIPVRKWDFF